MAKFNISQTAKLYDKDWKTVKRHIDKGTLSRGSDGLIDMAELIRAYGEPPENASPMPEPNNQAVPDHSLDHASPKIEALFGQQIKQLERQIDDLRQDKERLLGIVEKQTLLLEDKRKPEATDTTLKPQKTDKTELQKSPLTFWALFISGLAIAIITTALVTFWILNSDTSLGWIPSDWQVFVKSLADSFR